VNNFISNRPLRLLFAANFVSMLGSGLNTAAVNWYILQATQSEELLGLLVVAQSLPSLFLMPFSGVIVDREDRRHVVMFLDAARAVLILTVALLALYGSLQVWQLFVMSVLVSTGFWLFWPTITALLQELTPEGQFAHSNAMLLAGFQGGWLVAGAFVGFLYGRIGIGGILIIDLFTYVFSFTCYLLMRRGRQTAALHDVQHVDHPVRRFIREARESLVFVRARPSLGFLGLTWAFFVAAMMVTSVVTAPVSERIVHAGAVGYGWMNAGWGIGAFISTFYAARTIRRFGWRLIIPVSMLLMAASFCGLPFSVGIGVAAGLYLVAGVARGVGGIALSSSIMEAVPKHFMGRVSTLFGIAAIVVQVPLAPVVGRIAHNIGLTWAIFIIALLYLLAATSAWLSGKTAGQTHPTSAFEATPGD
jgi:DHA3 family macrolide efflux protein-like MFS transporter